MKEPGLSLTIAQSADHPFGLDIESSLPISAVSIERGDAFRRSASAYRVVWRSTGPQSLAGQPVEIRIDLQDRAEPISISGTVTQWGKFYHPADL